MPRAHSECKICKAAVNVKYLSLNATSSEKLESLPKHTKLEYPAKSALSGYRLAAHMYMVAKKQELISGRTTRTKALKIERKNKDTDSDFSYNLDP